MKYKKRVGCLYRVSTKKQAEKDDIPMQRIACKEFISKKEDWTLEKEYIELGVSGYKLSESERDALQDIKKDVLNKKIDVLLVFMFDRIGRKEEETPFVVEWLIKEGIEVWSVKEGQRKIENRADKLINYITYWQAGGESEKTSIRVKEAQTQNAVEGILTYGGTRNSPYGYQFIKSGQYTKKGVERQKLIINENEANTIRKIYEMYVLKGYGSSRIGKFLNNEKEKPRRGKIWSVSTIIKILKNPVYMGFPAYNKRTTKECKTAKQLPFEEWILPKKKVDGLAIISEEMWYKAQKIMKNRSDAYNPNCTSTENKPLQTKSQLLFIGMIKCGECSYAFMTSESNKKKKNGESVRYMYYKCSSTRSSDICTLEHKSIPKKDIEDNILQVVYDFLDSIEKIDLTNQIKNNLINNQAEEYKKIKRYEEKNIELDNNLKTLKNEIINCLKGTSQFSADLLNELIENKEEEKRKLESEINKLNTIIEQKKIGDKDIKEFKNMIPVWKEEFENANTEIKKMLLSEIIQEIRVYNDRIEIDLRIAINDYIKKNMEKSNYKIIEDTVCLMKN